ncbi:MAG TPA: diheme cytochrome c-553 [Candidatus Eisenbacteria bacterium]
MLRRNLPRLLLLGLLVVVAGCQTGTPETGSNTIPAATPPPVDPATRGKYLVTILGCNDCHTPMSGMGPDGPIFDQTHFLAGHPAALVMPPPPAPVGPWFAATNLTAWSGPWGISYAANITPDSLTGIGIWTEDVFIKALRTGRHVGVARPILPPMPWQSFAHMTDEDIKSVYAYLRTIPAVSNEVPQPVINGPPPAAEGTH